MIYAALFLAVVYAAVYLWARRVEPPHVENGDVITARQWARECDKPDPADSRYGTSHADWNAWGCKQYNMDLKKWEETR